MVKYETSYNGPECDVKCLLHLLSTPQHAYSFFILWVT
jgi:hypothetical protein